MSMYGNYNLAAVGKSQYLTVDSSSDTLTMSSGIQGLLLYSTTDCWVSIGPAPTAAAPGAEKTAVVSLFLPSSTIREFSVPKSTDEAPLLVAAIRDTADGVLHVQEWKLS